MRKSFSPFIIFLFILAFTICLLFGLPFLLPRNKKGVQHMECVANMMQIKGLKEIWIAENNAKKDDIVDEEKVKKMIHSFPSCPGGGQYIINHVGYPPECSIHGSCPDRMPKLHELEDMHYRRKVE